tara:strand:- start:4075 stop:4263 length:189 start_codon:yes stop_codon:yes gene_type:complete
MSFTEMALKRLHGVIEQSQTCTGLKPGMYPAARTHFLCLALNISIDNSAALGYNASGIENLG